MKVPPGKVLVGGVHHPEHLIDGAPQDLRGVDQPPRRDPSQAVTRRGHPSGLSADPPRSTPSGTGGSSSTNYSLLPKPVNPGPVSVFYCELCMEPTGNDSFRCDRHLSTRPLCSYCAVYPAEVIEWGVLSCLDVECMRRRP